MVIAANRNSDLITLTDAAKILSISREWLYTLIERGELHPIQIADRQFLDRVEVEKLKTKRQEK